MAAIDETHKSCTRCNQTLSTELFYEQQQKGNGKVWKYYDSMCKRCRKTYTRERALTAKKEAVEYKGGKCFDCKKVFHTNVYDFHHLDPKEKDFEFGERKGRALNDSTRKELDKCVLLCANCHRERHIVLVL